MDATGYALDNAIATLAVRRFTERYRKKYKVAPRHWLVTELGHGTTEHLHLHGLIWTHKKREVYKSKQIAQVKKFKAAIKDTWKYGHTGLGDYVNEKTVNYIIKYVMKMDATHKTYKPITLASQGIGANYIKRPDAQNNTYKPNDTREYYKTRQGFKLSLPIYYRNKLYTEEQREKLWIEKLNQQCRYVLGSKIDISKSEAAYYHALQAAQRKNNRLGYGQRDMWEVKEYEEQGRTLKQKQREVSTPVLYVDTETGEIFENPSKKFIHLHKLKHLTNLLC